MCYLYITSVWSLLSFHQYLVSKMMVENHPKETVIIILHWSGFMLRNCWYLRIVYLKWNPECTLFIPKLFSCWSWLEPALSNIWSLPWCKCILLQWTLPLQKHSLWAWRQMRYSYTFLSESTFALCDFYAIQSNGLVLSSVEKLNLGNICRANDKCKDPNAECSPVLSECACKDGFYQKQGKCGRYTFVFNPFHTTTRIGSLTLNIHLSSPCNSCGRSMHSWRPLYWHSCYLCPRKLPVYRRQLLRQESGML